MDPTKKITGLTLIELVVTLGVIGIVSAIGLPQFNEMIKNNTLVTNTNSFISIINYARTEAVSRETNVILCASSNAGNAIPQCNTQNWDSGWVLFSDVGNTPNNFDNNDILLRRAENTTVGNTVRANFAIPGQLTFAKNGFASSAGTISICDDRGLADSRGIAVTRVGHVNALGRGNGLACP